MNHAPQLSQAFRSEAMRSWTLPRECKHCGWRLNLLYHDIRNIFFCMMRWFWFHSSVCEELLSICCILDRLSVLCLIYVLSKLKHCQRWIERSCMLHLCFFLSLAYFCFCFYVDSYMLNYPWMPWLNLTWSWLMIICMFSWIPFASHVLDFASMFIDDIDK